MYILDENENGNGKIKMKYKIYNGQNRDFETEKVIE